jgi:hypothetical protein
MMPISNLLLSEHSVQSNVRKVKLAQHFRDIRSPPEQTTASARHVLHTLSARTMSPRGTAIGADIVVFDERPKRFYDEAESNLLVPSPKRCRARRLADAVASKVAPL